MINALTFTKQALNFTLSLWLVKKTYFLVYIPYNWCISLQISWCLYHHCGRIITDLLTFKFSRIFDLNKLARIIKHIEIRLVHQKNMIIYFQRSIWEGILGLNSSGRHWFYWRLRPCQSRPSHCYFQLFWINVSICGTKAQAPAHIM